MAKETIAIKKSAKHVSDTAKRLGLTGVTVTEVTGKSCKAKGSSGDLKKLLNAV